MFYEEVFMIGRKLFNKSDLQFKETMGATKCFESLHVIATGDFYQMAPVKNISIFKDDYKDYGPLAVNPRKTQIFFP